MDSWYSRVWIITQQLLVVPTEFLYESKSLWKATNTHAWWIYIYMFHKDPLWVSQPISQVPLVTPRYYSAWSHPQASPDVCQNSTISLSSCGWDLKKSYKKWVKPPPRKRPFKMCTWLTFFTGCFLKIQYPAARATSTPTPGIMTPKKHHRMGFSMVVSQHSCLKTWGLLK